MNSIFDKNRILIRYYREGESKSSISSDLKISKKTVKKYIEEHEQRYGKGSAKHHIEKGLTSTPALWYKLPKKAKVLIIV